MTEQANAMEIATPRELAPAVTLDELGVLVTSYSEGVGQATCRALRGSLAIGAAIMLYSERPDVKAEVEKVNHTGRHRPFTCAGWVARELARRFGDSLPGYPHLLACARAAEIARERGIGGGNLRKLLGWDLEAVNVFVGDGGLKLPRLPAPAHKDGPRPADRGEQIVRHFKRIALHAEQIASIAHTQTPAFRWTDFPEAKQEFDALIDRVNGDLRHVDLCLVDRKRRRR